MAIITKRKKQGELITEGTYTATHLPEKISNFLVLYSLTNGIPKTKVLRNQMTEWYAKHANLEKSLIDSLADNILISWKAEKSNAIQTKKSYSFSIFKKKLEQELYKTGMNQDFVNKISTAVNGKK